MTWPEIMGLIVLEGLLITVLVLTGFRRAVFEAIPPQLKTAIAVGIGFFLDHHRPGRRRHRAARAVPLISFGVNGQLAGWPLLVFVRRPAGHQRARRPQGQGRAADRHRVLDRAVHHHRGDRAHRAADRPDGKEVNAHGLGAAGADVPEQLVRARPTCR